MKVQFLHSATFAAGMAVLSSLAMFAANQNSPVTKAIDNANPSGAKAASPSTPRTADGHPDLNGLWNGGDVMPVALELGAGGDVDVSFAARGGSFVNFERDNMIVHRMDPNRPIYKPQYWEKVQFGDQNENTEDPSFGCFPGTVPRIGPPVQIVQTPTQLIFLYRAGDAGTTGDNYRVIPADGRPHTSPDDLEPSLNGESLAHWDGDTLEIDTVGFNDVSWLDTIGYFHSERMRVIERLHREGNTLSWQATIEDPEVLLKPWPMNPRTIRLNTDSKAVIQPSLPCSERDQHHMATKEHH
jgi:hypothetical protein